MFANVLFLTIKVGGFRGRIFFTQRQTLATKYIGYNTLVCGQLNIHLFLFQKSLISYQMSISLHIYHQAKKIVGFNELS
ncbi:hypothetical protein KQX54_013409 [Cotesia glomerata]|uniref:Uncharacterized protein n=1 Tax=Cotesia glomerata TaxID=32391 RepID=A0AAV7INW2_COTGL|nr:hypothetical protein KQX54_013409 [Cotesia glomerata]